MSTFRCRPPPRGIAERDLGAIAGFGVHRAFREIMGGSTRTDGETLRLGYLHSPLRHLLVGFGSSVDACPASGPRRQTLFNC
jgi:hypothetical protein